MSVWRGTRVCVAQMSNFMVVEAGKGFGVAKMGAWRRRTIWVHREAERKVEGNNVAARRGCFGRSLVLAAMICRRPETLRGERSDLEAHQSVHHIPSNSPTTISSSSYATHSSLIVFLRTSSSDGSLPLSLLCPNPNPVWFAVSTPSGASPFSSFFLLSPILVIFS